MSTEEQELPLLLVVPEKDSLSVRESKKLNKLIFEIDERHFQVSMEWALRERLVHGDPDVLCMVLENIAEVYTEDQMVLVFELVKKGDIEREAANMWRAGLKPVKKPDDEEKKKFARVWREAHKKNDPDQDGYTV